MKVKLLVFFNDASIDLSLFNQGNNREKSLAPYLENFEQFSFKIYRSIGSLTENTTDLVLKFYIQTFFHSQIVQILFITKLNPVLYSIFWDIVIHIKKTSTKLQSVKTSLRVSNYKWVYKEQSSRSKILSTTWKTSEYGVFFWSIFFPHSNWVRRFTLYLDCIQSKQGKIRTTKIAVFGQIRSISPYSVWMRENPNQNNSEHGHFLRSGLNN